MNRNLLLWTISVFVFIVMGACGTSTDENVPKEETTQNPVEKRLEALDNALKSDPNQPDLFAQRGELFYDNEIYDKAIEDFKASIKLDSSKPQVWHLLADAQLDNLKSREALNTMIYASTQFKDRVPTLLKLSEFQYILLKYEDALATLDRAVKIDPNEGEVFFMIGRIYKESGDTARAINSFQRATELNPDILDAWLNLGQLFELRGNSIAERYFKTATAIDRNSAMPFQILGDYYSRLNKFEEAQSAYNKSIIIDPQNEESFYNSGLVYLDMDSVNLAKQQFERAIEVRPTFVEARYYQGVALELQGNYQAAQNAYQQALNISPSFENAKQAIQRIKAKQ